MVFLLASFWFGVAVGFIFGVFFYLILEQLPVNKVWLSSHLTFFLGGGQVGGGVLWGSLLGAREDAEGYIFGCSLIFLCFAIPSFVFYLIASHRKKDRKNEANEDAGMLETQAHGLIAAAKAKLTSKVNR